MRGRAFVKNVNLKGYRKKCICENLEAKTYRK